jgi:hypothetical protein
MNWWTAVSHACGHGPERHSPDSFLFPLENNSKIPRKSQALSFVEMPLCSILIMF